MYTGGGPLPKQVNYAAPSGTVQQSAVSKSFVLLFQKKSVKPQQPVMKPV